MGKKIAPHSYVFKNISVLKGKPFFLLVLIVFHFQLSVGDNFYDSGVDFTTGGILRFEAAWVNMYTQGVFQKAPWYQCLGNHDIVKGQSGVDFQTKIAPLYDERWYFVRSALLQNAPFLLIRSSGSLAVGLTRPC